MASLISKETAHATANMIKDNITQTEDYYSGPIYGNQREILFTLTGMYVCKNQDEKETSTSHVSVIDQYGNAVAMTSSINS